MSGSLMMLLAGGGIRIAAFGGTLWGTDASAPYSATATLTLNSDGTNTRSATPSVTSNTVGAAWAASPYAGIGSAVWVRCTVTSGALSSGTTGTWLSLSAGQSWDVTRTSLGTSTAVITLDFALDSGGTTIIGSVSVTLRGEGV